MKENIVTFRFYTIQDVATMLGISQSSAQRMIKKMNAELEKQGFIVVAGKIGKTYFDGKIKF